MKSSTIAVLLILFAILTLISASMLYYSHQIPIEEKSVVTLYTYKHDGTFNYVVSLKPNTIYNKTTLNPNDGPVFTRIANDINVNFTYNFHGSGPANVTVRCNLTEHLETQIFRKQISEVLQKTVKTAGTSAELNLSNIPSVSVFSVQNLVSNISQETGVTINQYNVTIAVQMSIEASTPEGLINETFAPRLAMRFKSSFAEGNVISIDGLQHSKNGEITRNETIYQEWVNAQRYISYVLSAISFPGLLIMIQAYVRKRPRKPKTPEALIEEIIEPFKEAISEATQQPQFKEGFTRTSMTTLEDIVKVADILGKPIVHACQPPETHIFYAIDGTTLYEYTVTESSIIQKMKKEEEE